MLPSAVTGDASNLDFANWWSRGLGNASSRLLFGVTTLLLWKRRNRLVFDNDRAPVSAVCCQVKFWDRLFSSSWKALQMSREAPSSARQAQLIGWRQADEGCFSLNANGSLYSNRSSATAGGVIRDDNGRFVSAFTANFGTCSIMRA
ncbi:hypothetical protein LINPERHAP2_LOCUS23359 [Linum perenne]